MGKIKPIVRGPEYTEELRLGRNFVRKGDLVRVRPPDGAPAGTHGYQARFQYADVDKGGQYVVVFEMEKCEGVLQYARIRTVKPDRIERKATTHDPARAVAERAAARKQRSKK